MGILHFDRRELGRDLTPASLEQIEALRVIERARMKWDPSYITAEQAKAIPQEVADANPVLKARISASAPDWPERRMAAGQVFADVPGGEGEGVDRRVMDAEEAFTGGPLVPKTER